MKSLIKPPPSRNSWELLLDDYLNDLNFKTNLTSQLPINDFPPYIQSTHPYSQSISANLFHETSIPPSCYQYPLTSYHLSNHSLPPRRYKMTLDELVYLISQVGRSDLYREMIQYAKTQQIPTPSNISSNSSMNNRSSNAKGSSNRSRYKITTNIQSFSSNNFKKQ